MLKTRDNFWRSSVLYFIFIWFGLMIFTPNLLVLLASFLTKDPEWQLRLPLNFQNYVALSDKGLLIVMLKSIVLGVCITLFCLVFAYPFTYFISRFPKHVRPFFLMLIIVPFWTNSLVRTYALIPLLSKEGLLNSFLIKYGIIDAPLELLYTNTAVFLGMSYTLLPFMILPLYVTLEKMDLGLLEAAQDLGATSLSAFFRIVIPLSSSGIVAGCTMVFLPALTLFYVSDILGNSESLVIGSVIRDKIMVVKDWPVGAAISICLTVFMMILLHIYFKSGNSTQEEQQIW